MLHLKNIYFNQSANDLKTDSLDRVVSSVIAEMMPLSNAVEAIYKTTYKSETAPNFLSSVRRCISLSS